jgi:hypothetical protein
MEWAVLFSGLLGGGVIVFLFDNYYFKRGKIILQSCHLIVNYDDKGSYEAGGFTIHNRYIIDLRLDVQFINTSGHQALVTDFTLALYNIGEPTAFEFDSYKLFPAFPIPPRDGKMSTYYLKHGKGKIRMPHFDSRYKDTYFTIFYRINNQIEWYDVPRHSIEFNNISKTLKNQ